MRVVHKLPDWWRWLLQWVRSWIRLAPPNVPELSHDVMAHIATLVDPYAYPCTERGRADLSGVLIALRADRKTYVCMMRRHDAAILA
jgi:hypothetical protein